VAAALAFLPPLLGRLAVGHAFFLTGRGKLGNLEGITEYFSGLGIPFPAANAAFVSRLEYYGGMLLVVGLLTRVVSVMLASTMVVALITADRAEFLAALAGTIDKAPVDITAFAYLLLLLWLAIAGPGAVSLDALLKRWLLPRRAAGDAGSTTQPAAA
jgi:putative oxidoreductase